MKLINSLLLILSISSISFAQDDHLEWAYSINGLSGIYGTYESAGHVILTDDLGSAYICGYYEGAIDFDPGPNEYNTESQDKGIFIQKIDSSSNLIWVKTYSINGQYKDVRMILDDDNIYLTGSFSVGDFDPSLDTLTLVGEWNGDTFITKLDSEGDLIWVKSWGSEKWEFGSNVAVDIMKNIYITGNFSDTIDFDPGPGVHQLSPNPGSTDSYLLKLDSNGGFVWVKHYEYEFVTSIIIDDADDIFICGNFGYFGGTFVQKMDTDSNIIWSNETDPSCWGWDDNKARDIVIDEEGNTYIVGNFSCGIYFDPGTNTYLSSNGQEDIFVQKLDEDGNFVWAKSFGDNRDDNAFAITQDHAGNLIITGFFEGSVDFDPGPNEYYLESEFQKDIFILKLTSDGHFEYAKSIGSNLNTGDQGNSITTDKYGSVYATGCYQGLADFDSDTTSEFVMYSGCKSAFVMKLSPCVISSTISNDSTISAYTSGASYQWVDCNDNFSEIFGETGQTFTSTEYSSVAVIVNQNGCIDTSSCNTILSIEMINKDMLTSIYPNPTIRPVNINLAGLKDVMVKVYTSYGQLIHQQNHINNSIYQFEINDEPGFYLIEIISNKKTESFKLLLN